MSRPVTSEGGFSIVDADWQHRQADIRNIRHAVFVQEQGIPEHLEWDGSDTGCYHALALSEDGRPVGTGRLQPDGKLGRMAVLGEWRGRGIGRAILEHLQQRARHRQLAAVYLHAQAGSEGFYRQAGFNTQGKAFAEAGILHVEMIKRLD